MRLWILTIYIFLCGPISIQSPRVVWCFNNSVQFSRSVMSNSLWPHVLQHARLPCPLRTSGAYSNSCPSSLVVPSNHLIFCRPLLLLPSIFNNYPWLTTMETSLCSILVENAWKRFTVFSPQSAHQRASCHFIFYYGWMSRCKKEWPT